MKYEVEYYELESGIDVDIKYPCGEVIVGWSCDSQKDAERKTNEWLSKNKFKPHYSCKFEYCNE